MMPTLPRRFPYALCSVLALAATGSAQERVPSQGAQRSQGAQNPYRLEPFEPGYPVVLEYPPKQGLEYVRTRRQALKRLADNLQGDVRREAWQLATEFFWRAPEEAVDPLVEAMDRAMGNPALGDVVRNCVEAMGKMGNPELDSALRRALEHKKPAVRQAAYAAIATSGAPETVRWLLKDFVRMDGRARQAWLRGVRRRLPDDRVEILQGLMMAEYPTQVRDQVLEQVVELPVAEAAEVLKPRWAQAVDEFKAIIAGVLHAAGDGAGTAWLRDAMNGQDLARTIVAVRHCIFGPDPDAAIGVLREDLLKLSTHLRPEVRLEVVQQLARVDGDDVADVLEVLTGPDEIWEIRAVAMRELTRRGRDQLVEVLLEELPTATGTRLQSVVNQLAVSGDPRAVPMLVERFEKSPAGEGRAFLRALAQNGSDAAARALCDIFEAEDKLVVSSDDNPMTTRNYLPLVLLNLRGPERLVLERWLALPKDAWQLRAPLMSTIAGYAVDRRDQPELRDACIEPVRAVLFDQSELPQLRVQALNLLAKNWLTVDDAMRLKHMLREEKPGMRALLSDFLNDAF